MHEFRAEHAHCLSKLTGLLLQAHSGGGCLFHPRWSQMARFGSDNGKAATLDQLIFQFRYFSSRNFYPAILSSASTTRL